MSETKQSSAKLATEWL